MTVGLASHAMNTEFELFPDAASTAASQVDALYWFLVILSAVMSVAIAATLVFFAVKYRKSAAVDRTQRPTSISTELTWIFAALPVLLFIFVWGAKVGFFLMRPPADAMAINVVAKQWMWKFQHPDGRREIDTLHVPVGQSVRLTMVSQDVIHSFFVPAFRVKQDVLPGRYTNVWFQATKPGSYRLYCAEYCGTNHSRMVGTIVAQTPADFAAWLAGDSSADEPPQVAGEKLFDQLQCGTCHRRDGEPGRGPSLVGLFGANVPLTTGIAAQVDDAYLRESILRPAEKVVAGYQPLMPTYEGQISEEGVMELIAYIKSLQAPIASPAP
jgi:cytochrome c oxidase subunit 2